MLVIDASALIDVLTVNPTDIPALAGRVHDVEWMSTPDLLDYELLNVLRKMVVRGDIDEQLAGESRLALRDLRLSRHPMTDSLSDRIWQLRHNMSAYDAAYVALAEELETPLITTDRRLAEAATKLTKITVESYVTVESY